MRLRPAGAGDAGAWQELLEASASGDFLHDWEWAEVARFDGQPQHRFVLEEDGRLTALVAAQVRSLGGGRAFWYVPHGPVMDYAAPDALPRLRSVVAGLKAAGRDARAVTVRLEPRLEKGSREARLFGGAGVRAVPGYLQVGHTRLVELTDDETLLASFSQTTRNGIRRADREGVQVVFSQDAADSGAVDRLFELSEITRQRAGFPFRPRERLELTWRQLASAGRAAMAEARFEGQSLAAAMLVIEGWRSFYYVAGSRREQAGGRKLFPTHALQWALMRHARDRGARVHDLWGVAPPDAGPEHPWHGVGTFKRGFGGREIAWAGMWDVIVDPLLYWAREAAHPLLDAVRRVRRR
jgi:peptidoglycan pentaglycine glycine transferase (the first glycine)